MVLPHGWNPVGKVSPSLVRCGRSATEMVGEEGVGDQTACAAGGFPRCGVPVPIISHRQSTPISFNKVAPQPARHVPLRFQ